MSQTMPPVPPLPPGPGHQTSPAFAPVPPPPWYYQKWFVVLVLLVFPPIGLFLLWKSPVTKLAGRIAWSIFAPIWFFVLIAINTADPTATPTDTAGGQTNPPAASAPATTAPASKEPAKAATPPKSDYDFAVTNKDSGQVFKGKTASNVGFAVLETTKAKTVGDSFFTEKATSGATFALVRVYIKNEQKDAITLDGSLLKLLYEGREYSYSSQAQTALEMADQTEIIFLKQLNPGLAVQAIVPFEVPEDINLDKAQIQFRGGMVGKTTTVPALPVTE